LGTEAAGFGDGAAALGTVPTAFGAGFDSGDASPVLGGHEMPLAPLPPLPPLLDLPNLPLTPLPDDAAGTDAPPSLHTAACNSVGERPYLYFPSAFPANLAELIS
jgi:hypothetical protein